jgi:RNA polymerase subunit RPABC4/transcription elongation factor Spt4
MNRRKCPYCKEYIDQDALICPHCQHELSDSSDPLAIPK